MRLDELRGPVEAVHLISELLVLRLKHFLDLFALALLLSEQRELVFGLGQVGRNLVVIGSGAGHRGLSTLDLRVVLRHHRVEVVEPSHICLLEVLLHLAVLVDDRV